MIHKISFKGYVTGSPFKLMYLADETGISDLSEAYPILLLLPIISEEAREEVLTWVSSPYAKYKHDEKNRYIYRGWQQDDSEYKKELTERDAKVAYLEGIERSCIENLESILVEGTSIVVPIALTKDNDIRYLLNAKSTRAKGIKKLEESLAEALANKSWGGWYATQEDRARSSLLAASSVSWLKAARLVVNSEVKKHPCVMCPNALHNLQGGCSFGGTTCSSNLSLIFKEESPNAGT